jgi:hypothetical protein
MGQGTYRSGIARGPVSRQHFAVTRILRRFVIAATLALSVASTQAAVLLHEYALRGNLDDNRGGPSLIGLGGQITALGYVFAANQGLTLTSSALNTASFSLEVSFRFDSTSGYRKIADFHDRADDTGFYQLNTALNFYPVTSGPTGDFSPGVDVHVVLTRDGTTNVVTGYVNGQERFSFVDSSSIATFTAAKKLTLFTDDSATSGEASAGTANYIRVFDGALTASEVSALHAAGAPLAVPEPSTLALVAIGAVLMAGYFRRRR